VQRSLAERVAGEGTCRVSGTFYRHAAPGRDAFSGVTLGRWGKTFPVIYVGRPATSVTVEAYRHLVEPFGIPVAAVRPRVFYTVTVNVHLVLDLTSPGHLTSVGLTAADLTSAVDDYGVCQDIARAAHQLELHGILAPAATGLGETLALFAQRISAAERPVVISETIWSELPPDPRIPHLVDKSVSGGTARALQMTTRIE
jgi:RES domain